VAKIEGRKKRVFIKQESSQNVNGKTYEQCFVEAQDTLNLNYYLLSRYCDNEKNLKSKQKVMDKISKIQALAKELYEQVD